MRFFTAAVKPGEWDRSQHLRQGAYLRALDALPDVSVLKGRFARWKVRRPLVDAPPEGPQTALQKTAAQEGLPYQTLISSILHKYINGRLIERPR